MHLCVVAYHHGAHRPSYGRGPASQLQFHSSSEQKKALKPKPHTQTPNPNTRIQVSMRFSCISIPRQNPPQKKPKPQIMQACCRPNPGQKART